MNSEAYIGFYESGKLQLFPNNIGTGIVLECCKTIPVYKDTLLPECLFIKRQDRMVYYIFVKRTVEFDDMYLCAVIVLNSVLISDIFMLYDFFKERLSEIINRYKRNKLNSYESLLKWSVNIRRAFNLRFNNVGDNLGAIDYSSQYGINAIIIDDVNNIIIQAAKEKNILKSIKSGDLQIVTDEFVFDYVRLYQAKITVKRHKNRSRKKDIVYVIVGIGILAIIFCTYKPYMHRKVSVSDTAIAITEHVNTEPLEHKILSTEGVAKDGHLIHYFEGYFSAKGSKYPVKLAFIQINNRISKVIYKSVIYGGKLTMKFKFVKDEIILSAKDGNNDFVIRLHPDGANYVGEAINGKSIMDVYLTTSNEPFKINNLD